MTSWVEAGYDDLLARRHGDRPYVVVNMVASVDGAISVDGRSSRLGGPADRELFLHLRSLADVILVGAQTVRAERYGPPRLPVDEQEERRRRGQEPLPRLTIVSRRAAFDPGARVFTDGYRPAVLVPVDAEPDQVAATRRLADVIEVGTGGVDIREALDHLGPGLVLCEGGPTLNGELAAADLVDELCLTVAGSFVGGPGGGLLGRGALAEPLELRLVGARQREGDLFLRYRRADRPATAAPVADDGSTGAADIEVGTGDAVGVGVDVDVDVVVDVNVEEPAAFATLTGDLDRPMMIVTTAVGTERAGCLVGFGSQASIHPGRFGVWLSKANHTHDLARRADVFAVHFPSAADRALAALFGETTGDEIDKFERCQWHEGPGGVPLLDEIGRWFAGRAVDRLDTGDHTLVVLAPFAGDAGAWPGGQLGLQAVADLVAGHPA